jgi:hypothetical protein
MGKHPSNPQLSDEAPTEKRSIPRELRDPPPEGYVTTRIRKEELEEVLKRHDERNAVNEERNPTKPAPKPAPDAGGSGLRPAVTDDEIARFKRREVDTIPAPPDPEASNDIDVDIDFDFDLDPDPDSDPKGGPGAGSKT